MRKAIFVVGPESSGTRMMTQFFIRAGYEGDHGHSQPWDNLVFRKYPDNIVFRQSMPHGNRWVDIVGIIQGMQKANYTPYGIVMWRDPRYMALSQVQAGHSANTVQALSKIRKAILHIDTAFDDLGWRPTLIIYEKFVEMPEYQKAIHGLHSQLDYDPMEFKNANQKYTRSDLRGLNDKNLKMIAEELGRAKAFRGA